MKIFTLLLVSIFTLLSCEAPVDDMGVGYVAVATEEKPLSFIDDGDVVSIEYQAEPLFTVIGHNIIGKTNGFVAVNFSGSVSEVMGPFSQGKWRFQVRAINSSGAYLYYAEKTQYVSQGSTSVIKLDVRRAEGEGLIIFNIRCPLMEVSATTKLYCYINGRTFSDFQKTVDGSIVRFTGQISVPAGKHALTFSYANGGEAMSVNVVPGDTVAVNGTILASSYEISGINVSVPGQVFGHVSGPRNKEPAQNITLSFVKDQGVVESDEIHWYLNGTDTGKTGFSYIFMERKEGIYSVSALIKRLRSATNYGSADYTVTWEENTSDSYQVRVKTLYSVTVNSSQIIAPTSGRYQYKDSTGKIITFPYTTKVEQLHPDNRYTPYELKLTATLI